MPDLADSAPGYGGYPVWKTLHGRVSRMRPVNPVLDFTKPFFKGIPATRIQPGW